MNTLNKIFITMLFVFGAMLSSCEGDLADLNIDPNKSTVMTYDAQLLRIELYISGGRGLHQFISGLNGAAIQHLASLSTGGGAPGDKYMHPRGNAGGSDVR